MLGKLKDMLELGNNKKKPVWEENFVIESLEINKVT